MIPSYFEIEILAIRTLLWPLCNKGLRQWCSLKRKIITFPISLKCNIKATYIQMTTRKFESWIFKLVIALKLLNFFQKILFLPRIFMRVDKWTGQRKSFTPTPPRRSGSWSSNGFFHNCEWPSKRVKRSVLPFENPFFCWYLHSISKNIFPFECSFIFLNNKKLQ